MKTNSIPSAGTNAEQITDVEHTNVSPFFAKPIVGSRQVRKFKVEQNDDVITKYYWKKLFLCFGQWIPYQNTASNTDAYAKTFIKKIDDFIYAIENR